MQLARTFCLTALALASSLHAQQGTGHAGVAGPGFAPGAGRSGAAHAPNNAQTFGPNLGGQPYPIRTDIPTPVGLNAPAASYTGILPGALKSTNSYSGRGSRGFSGLVAPFYLPPYVDTSISSFPGYNAALPIDPNAQALANSQEALAQQIQQLTTEIQQMKSSGQQPPPVSAPMSSVVPEQQHRPPTPPVTLVLRDGQQLTVESYAVMNQTFWNFSKHPVQKIPISSIDIAASAKATEANGGEFPQIGSAQ